MLELPTQSEGEGYRVPWVLVIDEATFPPDWGAQVGEVIRSFGGEGVLVFPERVELGDIEPPAEQQPEPWSEQ